MDGLVKFLKANGFDDAEILMAEVEWFLDEPAVFFEMTAEERAAMLSRMDAALAEL